MNIKIENISNNSEKNTSQKVSEELISAQFLVKPALGFESLFKTYYQNLCNHSVRYLHSKEMAEDVVSEVFIYFWKNELYKTVTKSYVSYLYKAVKNNSLQALKKEMMLEPISEDANFYNPELSPDDILSFFELSQKIDLQIKNLPKKSKQAFEMHRLENMKYAEIASEMKISVSAVERLISRALAKLRESLKTELY